MSDLPFSTEQPIGTAQLSLARAAQELQRALRSLKYVGHSQEAQDAIHAAEFAVRQAELALQDTEAMLARELGHPQVLELQADPSAAAAVVNDFNDLKVRQGSAAEEREQPAALEPGLDEPMASTDDEELEGFEAELERTAEDRPLYESDALNFVGTLALNADGDDLGEVQELVLGPQGVVQAVVLNNAGSNGLPERQVRIDWSEVQVSADNRLVVYLSPDDLQLSGHP
jgi:hypothetical protein